MKSLFQTGFRLLFVALLMTAGFAVSASAQDPRLQLSSLDRLAAKASQTVDVNIDGQLLRVVARVLSDRDSEEKNIKELLTGIKGIYVRSFTFENDGQYSTADVEPIRAQLRAPGWTRLVNVASKKEGSVEVYLLMEGQQVGGLTVLSTENRELSVINIVGPVDLDKLAELEGQFGVPELGIKSTKPKPKE